MLQSRGADEPTLRLLKELMEVKALKQFHLCGGTALSLHFGHRLSIDLDLFSPEVLDKPFLEEILTENFDDFAPVFTRVKSFYFCYINKIKVDFVYTPAPVIAEFAEMEAIRFWGLPDIIAMKLNAIYGRGSKKDFWDLYEILNHFSMKEIVDFFFKKYPAAFEEGLYMSLVYFDDAEGQADPKSFNKQRWQNIKTTIEKEVRNAFFN